MKFKILFSVILVSIVLACEDADKKQDPQPETVLPETAPLVAPTPELLKSENAATSFRKKSLDTRITPDMINNLNFNATGEAAETGKEAEMILNPSGKTKVMVTPKLFLDESDQVKEKYIEYIDGAAVELEVKFD